MTRQDLLQAFFVDTEIDRTYRYLLRGRRHAGLSEQGLRELWVDTYLAFAVTDFLVRRFRNTLLDLRCEFQLRRLSVPMDAVAAVHARYMKHVERQTRDRRHDPEDREYCRAEFAALRERLARPKH